MILIRLSRPHGVLHVDEYTNKDIYRMVYMVPIDKLKKYRRVFLVVKNKKWPTESPDSEEIV